MATTKRLTEDEIATLNRLAAEGHSRSEIQKITGRSRGTVMKYLPHHTTKRLVTTEEKEQIVRQYTSGVTIRNIETSLNVPRTTIASVLSREGVKTRKDPGPNHPRYKTGRSVNEEGYVLRYIDKSDPFVCMAKSKNSQTSYYVSEHRYVMATHLGRPLTSKETVHHKDGDRSNNHISNLQLLHTRHVKGCACHCARCGSIDIVYDELVIAHEDVKSATKSK